MHQFYFLNETGLRLDYTRRYARAPAGWRVGALNQRNFAFYIGRVLALRRRAGVGRLACAPARWTAAGAGPARRAVSATLLAGFHSD
ncbi:hypothetical protein GCM10027346_04100 [Hymenobacter seoulensis]